MQLTALGRICGRGWRIDLKRQLIAAFDSKGGYAEFRVRLPGMTGYYCASCSLGSNQDYSQGHHLEQCPGLIIVIIIIIIISCFIIIIISCFIIIIISCFIM